MSFLTDVINTLYDLLLNIFDFLLTLPNYILNVFDFMKVIYIELPNFILGMIGHFPSFVETGFTVIFNLILTVLILRFVGLIMSIIK